MYVWAVHCLLWHLLFFIFFFYEHRIKFLHRERRYFSPTYFTAIENIKKEWKERKRRNDDIKCE